MTHTFFLTRHPLVWRQAFLCTLLWLAMLSLPAVSRGADDQPFERWYVVNMEGQPTGHVHAQEKIEGEHLVDTSFMKLEIRRGDIALGIEMDSRFVETKDGKPVEAVNIQKISHMATKTTLRFEPDKVVVITEQGKQRTERSSIPSNKPWLTPAAQARQLQQALKDGQKVIKAWSIEASLGPEPFETTHTILGQEEVAIMGRTVKATKVESTTTRMPGIVSTSYVDDQGRPVKLNMTVGGLSFEVVQAPKEVALAPVNPPQLLAMMLITPEKKIPQPRQLRQGMYELTIGKLPDGKAVPLPESFLPAGAYQRVVWADDSTVRVVVDLDHPVAPGKDLPTEADKAASPMLDTADPQVKQLAQRALQGVAADAPAAVKAEALRKFVYGYINKKDLSVGFASAGEVARTAQGDCTEHGVLLAALLRSSGIPSRTVSGLVYVDSFEGHDNIFGYHMWTRAWVDGRWIDLDATLDEVYAYDATHIALGVSSMDQGAMANDMLVLAPVMGKLKIEPVSLGRK